MVEEEPGNSQPVWTEEGGSGPSGSDPKGPGWYPARTNPNQQLYWDGEAWTGERSWTVGSGWTNSGDFPGNEPSPPASSEGTSRYLSANPYGQATTDAKRKRLRRAARQDPSAVTLSHLLLMASGVALMAGSATTWVHANVSYGPVFRASASLNGLDTGISRLVGINGYATFICGVAVVALTAVTMGSDDWSVRVFCALSSLSALGFSVYFIVRVQQEIGQTPSTHGSAGSGAGLIMVLVSSALATVISVPRVFTA